MTVFYFACGVGLGWWCGFHFAHISGRIDADIASLGMAEWSAGRNTARTLTVCGTETGPVEFGEGHIHRENGEGPR